MILVYKIFDMLEKDLEFKHWYFGHFHDVQEIEDKYTLLYKRIIALE